MLVLQPFEFGLLVCHIPQARVSLFFLVAGSCSSGSGSSGSSCLNGRLRALAGVCSTGTYSYVLAFGGFKSLGAELVLCFIHELLFEFGDGRHLRIENLFAHVRLVTHASPFGDELEVFALFVLE